mmetsp:Transcript_10450/g.18246  ORF Transcript_10450/g.18246 Transcript_10450/m.18246 type:complete len:232 (-) Transcript_10450:391-1086(-)
MTPEMSTPRQSKNVPGMMAPLKSSSSDTPERVATSPMSTQLNELSICLLERSVADWKSGHTFRSWKRAKLTTPADPRRMPALVQLPNPLGIARYCAKSTSSVPRTLGAFVWAYARKKRPSTVIHRVVPKHAPKTCDWVTFGKSSPLAAAEGDKRSIWGSAAADASGLTSSVLLPLPVRELPACLRELKEGEPMKPVLGFHSGMGASLLSFPSSDQLQGCWLIALGLGANTG